MRLTKSGKEKYYRKIWVKFAWMPVRMDNGMLIWLEPYLRVSGASLSFGEYFERNEHRDRLFTTYDFKRIVKEDPFVFFRDFEFVNGPLTHWSINTFKSNK